MEFEQDEQWVVQLSKVKSEKQQWLWENYFPVGDISIIAGIQGIGKSITTVDFTARVTTGRKWPDGTRCKEGSVVFMSAEDHIANTIRPRMDAAGAAANNVLAILGAPDPKIGGLMQFDVFGNMDRLTYVLDNMKKITGLPPRMVIIDPVSSYVGNIDANRETQVRKVLFYLRANIAVKYNVAVICVMHVKKGAEEAPALERIMGSVAFTGSARCVWAFCQCPEDDDKRYLIPVKHNLIKRSTNGYELFVKTARNGHGVITWGNPSDKVAEDLMIDRGMRPEAKKTKAMEIIREHIESGPQQASIIMEAVVAADISVRTCNNAKIALGVISVKVGSNWMWYLPGVGKPFRAPSGSSATDSVKKTAKPKLSETEKLKNSITRKTKHSIGKPKAKTESQLTKEELDRVTRCVREFERGNFAPEPE